MKKILLLVCMICTISFPVQAAGFAASFNNADIGEFINTVSAALNRTIIISPTVKGKISVRSYKELNKEQYYELFLSVLDVHGFSVLEQADGTLKVVRSKDGKTAALPVVSDTGNPADRLVTWVLPVNNVPVRELSPILRQMNATFGNVVNFNPSNILIITGRAANVERLVSIVERIDSVGAKDVEVISLQYTSAAEMTRILTSIYLGKSNATATVVANEQGNQLIIAGNPEILTRMKKLALQLDSERAVGAGNSRVFYLRYARAKDLEPVLEGAAATFFKTPAAAKKGGPEQVSIEVHEQNNALVITAQPDLMSTLEGLIEELDIRRAQVMVEAIIAEVAEGDGINLSLQLASKSGSIIQFQDGSTVPIGEIIAGVADARGTKGTTTTTTKSDGTVITNKTPDSEGDYSTLAKALSKLSGAAFTVTSGNWAALLQAVSTSSKSNVLSTPSLMTLDNQPAFFIVGDEVPTITGSTSGSNNDNPYQTVERKQVGVKLQVTPQVNEGDAVRLDIEQEVSKVNGRTPVDVTFSTRQVKTSVMVRSGDTVVIGGLIDDDVQESVSKVPLLGDIPWVGQLFRSTASKKVKRNLMIFIRPTILRDDSMLQSVSAGKYSLIRAEQLAQNDAGIALMPQENIPVLPRLTQAGQLLLNLQQEMEMQKQADDRKAARNPLQSGPRQDDR
ncbi:type II secretion system secretin GspD [Sansalvadorimonas sp. 2012CJ34-2]|uniref:Type II secretion system secretin GspD n=1 Tax=Parendozoicomonas callyspongiae TaxID=2942213 RepID=A0ABT0PDV5_9GAMM|nr:type II secretion system secretin GspD [Sansalvadorimonas sp. 2012CJ34-2]MCL6268738.1 type II secretion system secretin GspD [Sansalvadorimonas sp. 2012CJ34-2]